MEHNHMFGQRSLRDELLRGWLRLQRHLWYYHVRKCPEPQVRHHRRQHQHWFSYLPHGVRHQVSDVHTARQRVHLRRWCEQPALWLERSPVLRVYGPGWWCREVPYQQGRSQVRYRILRLSVPSRPKVHQRSSNSPPNKSWFLRGSNIIWLWSRPMLKAGAHQPTTPTLAMATMGHAYY